MKKNLINITLSMLLMLVLAINAGANVTSLDDILYKIDTLNQITNYGFESFINKSELIGERLRNFELQTAQYKNEVLLVQENMKNLINQIELINASSDMPAEEKELKIKKLYQDADTMLYSVNSKTVQYLYNIRMSMPSLTYQRYARDFQAYYDSLNISK